MGSSCTIITPVKIARHPRNLFKSKVWLISNHPAIVAKTPSIDKIIAAGAGLAFRCAIICKVYPKPADRTPVYNISNHSIEIFFKVGLS